MSGAVNIIGFDFTCHVSHYNVYDCEWPSFAILYVFSVGSSSVADAAFSQWKTFENILVCEYRAENSFSCVHVTAFPFSRKQKSLLGTKNHRINNNRLIVVPLDPTLAILFSSEASHYVVSYRFFVYLPVKSTATGNDRYEFSSVDDIYCETYETIKQNLISTHQHHESHSSHLFPFLNKMEGDRINSRAFACTYICVWTRCVLKQMNLFIVDIFAGEMNRLMDVDVYWIIRTASYLSIVFYFSSFLFKRERKKSPISHMANGDVDVAHCPAFVTWMARATWTVLFSIYHMHLYYAVSWGRAVPG